MTTYWFRPKRYGYGATPITWQGWALTLATVLAMVVVWLYLRPTAHSLGTLIGLLAFNAVVLAILAIVSRRKTNGAWRWRWGQEP